jgi:hypothetical protein
MLSNFLVAAALALAASAFMLLTRLRAPLGADEGYLWYGLQQLRRGRLPHRDFKSYEPGRYLWCAGVSLLLGSGLASVRLGSHLFFALGSCIALFVLHRLGLTWAALVPCALALTCWSHPQHKQFEHGCLLLAWASQAWMLLAASPLAFELAFATCGMLLLVGFNLFLYAAAALALELLLALALGWHDAGRVPWVPCAVALVAGMAPFLLMLVSPGFARNFWRRRVASVFARGSANLPLPKPWPWRRSTPQLPDDSRRAAFRWLFLALVVLPWIALVAIALAPPAGARAGLLAAASLAAFVAHHAASRADGSHFAQAISPLLLLLFCLSATFAPVAGPWLLVLISAWMTWPMLRRQTGLPLREVGGLRIAMLPEMSVVLDRALAHGGGDGDFFAAPAYPALYAMLHCESPVYDTFCLYPADAHAQQRMIAAIERHATKVALVSNEPIDGREELRFSNTHPRVWQFLQERYRAMPLPEAGEDVYEFTTG